MNIFRIRNWIRKKQQQQNNCISFTDELLDSRTLFADIIAALETIIHPTKTAQEDIYNDSLNDSLDIQSFRKFESQNTQKITVSQINIKESSIDL